MRTDFIFDQLDELELKGLSQSCEVEVGEGTDLVLIGVVDQFGNQGMDMGVPFQVAAEGVQCRNHAEVEGVAEILVKIAYGLQLQTAQFFQKLAVDEGANRIPGRNEKELQTGTLLQEPVAKFAGNGEDNMPVADIKGKGSDLGGQLFGIFDTAGAAETGMAVSRDDVFVKAVCAFKKVVSKIRGIAEKHAFNIVANTWTCLAGFIEFDYKVMIIEEERLDRMSDIIIDKVAMIGIVMKENLIIESVVYHTLSIDRI